MYSALLHIRIRGVYRKIVKRQRIWSRCIQRGVYRKSAGISANKDGREHTPVFIAIPSVKSWKAVEREEEYVARILHRALGFYIKIRK